MSEIVSSSVRSPGTMDPGTTVTSTRQEHVQAVIDSYTRCTVKSKQLAEANRPGLAEKSSIGSHFSMEMKEACYPVAVAEAQGVQLRDIDGNRYIDVLMGLGANLLGHNPPFVREAIERQLQKSIVIGVQTELAGAVAGLVRRLTGMERVTFSNTGTEAVMTAVRVARAATGHSKIAVFTNSYHGHFDAALMRAPRSEYARKWAVRWLNARPWLGAATRLLERRLNTRAVPAALGIPPAAARDVVVLEYGNPRSLDVIQRLRRSLAAVLVEPVQSRCPELQPREFLQELRALTRKTQVALIFDEMVTGFRVHPGGAQAYFGVEADMATYSKIIGGGLPLSVIAGSARFMDRIDGGAWRFRDRSTPMVPATFFAGTFCKHPLALSSAHAVLSHLQEAGPGLQNGLNHKTTKLVSRLNEFTAQVGIPVVFTHFGSFFSIALTASQISPLAIVLLSYHLLNHGIHLRIGDKGGFLSTSHSASDIEAIITAFEDGLRRLHEGGFV